MKAERRHELQSNSLAMWVQIRLPELWQKYGNHILVALIIAVAGVWFIRWRIEAPKAAATRTTIILAEVSRAISALRQDPRELPQLSNVPDQIAEALNTSENKDLQAMAYVLLGEYHWTLATLPVIPEAATRPSLRPKQSSDELYTICDANAASALATGTAQSDLVARAQTLKAMVAEQRAFAYFQKEGLKADPAKNPFWAQAIASYTAIIDNPDMLPVLKQDAKVKLKAVEQMQQKPIWLVDREPTTAPSGPEAPSGTTRPATRPATQPAK